MLKRLFRQHIESITTAAVFVALSSLASRLLGVWRDRVLAGTFGAGPELDMYYAAFRIPDLIFNLLVLGALSAGFIPVFTKIIKDMKCNDKFCYTDSPNKEAWELANNVLNVVVLVLLGISLFGITLAPLVTHFIVPGFSGEEKNITIILTRIMFLSPIFLAISGVLGGILQSFKRFLIFSLAPIMYNVGIIIGAIFFVPHMGLYGLAWGVVLGAFLHAIIQIPTVRSLGFRYKLFIKFCDQNLRQIMKMMIPRTLSLAISQINLVVITIIASSLPGGALSAFNFANNLQSFPVGIFGISFAVAAFPALAEYAFNEKKLIENFSRTVRQILFFVIPSTALLIILRAQIIRVVLGSGQFDWQATVLTMDSLGFFAISLFAQALIPLLVRVFYARQNSRTPFFIGLISVVANIVLSIPLSHKFGASGLALAFSLANILNFVLLWLVLSLRLGDLDEKKIIISVLKFVGATLAGGGVAQFMKSFIWPAVDMSKFSGVFLQGLIAGSSGLLIYIFICYLLKSEEYYEFLNSLKKRLPWTKVKTDDQGEARI
jgi:putative peptidoglycan lipid II flippase